MKYRVTVGAIGWIDKRGPWPFLHPADIEAFIGQIASSADKLHTARDIYSMVSTYLALMATSNSAPPAGRLDFTAYNATRDFRALVWADLEFSEGRPGASGPVGASYAQSEAKSAIINEGYTAALDPNKVPEFGETVKGLQRLARELAALELAGGNPGRAAVLLLVSSLSPAELIQRLLAEQPAPGERSGLSGIRLDRRHDNTMLPDLPAGERLIANGLLRFRAGSHTDQMGQTRALSSHHVPWVWVEFLLTSLGHGQLRLRGAGSIFPTIAWYLNDQQVAPPHRQISDTAYPHPLDPRTMAISPVLNAGPPTAGGPYPATADARYAGRKAPVVNLPYTCPGGGFVDVRLTARPLASA